MNEILELRLRDFMDSADGWGHEQGREVYNKLLRKIESHAESLIIRVSLAGVRRTDASFPRESVVELAKRYRGNRGFCLVDIGDQDLLDNWDAAATKRSQPLIAWQGASYRILGKPQLSNTKSQVLEFVMDESPISAAQATKRLNLSLQNASTQLKQLLDQGLVLRQARSSATGGVEYVYRRIR